METKEHKADLIAGFGSFKFIPMPIVFSTNNANPKLILHEEHVEYRGGFITRRVNYNEIEKVDVYFIGTRTNNLVIYKKTGISTFIGNFRKRNQLQEFLQLFQKKGCTLTEKALAELK